ncbi:MAG: ABC transporter permease [Ignavibacteria bacterium]|jgi:putative ABC transport system permease protein
MFNNYLVVSFRNLLKNKISTIINIIGLAAGIACCVLIFLYVTNELDYDKQHKNGDRIFRILFSKNTPDGSSIHTTTPPPLASVVLNDFSYVEHAVRFLRFDNPLPLVSYENNKFYEKEFLFADQSVFEVFTLNFLSGNPQTALAKPNTIVITEKIASKYFGEESPVGKTLTLNNFIDLEVTGVLEDNQPNSTLRFDFLTSFSTLHGWLGEGFVNNWQNNMCQTYVLLQQERNANEFEKISPDFIKKYYGSNQQVKEIYLQPLNRIHLYSHQDYGISSTGNIIYIYLLISIALFTLIIACINFVNLTTAKSIKRAREVGIRKVVGASKKQLIYQFLSETVFLVLISIVVSIIVVYLVSPQFYEITGRSFSFELFKNWQLLLGLLGFGILIGLLSGIYPAFVLSSFNPAYTLKGTKGNSHGKSYFRKILVILQFTISIILIIGTTVIYNQLKFIQTKNLGFDKEQVLIIPVQEQNLRQNPEPLKNRMLLIPGVKKVAAAALLPGGPVGKTQYRLNTTSEYETISQLWVDHDFIKTLNFQLVAGRDFSKEFNTDSDNAFIINEEAARQFGWSNYSDAVGKHFEFQGNHSSGKSGKEGIIIGVVKDFHFTSMYNSIEPIVLHLWPWSNYILVKFNAVNLPNTLSELENIFTEFDSEHPFTYSFLEDKFNDLYKSERRIGKTVNIFTGLAVFIACLGLFGLSAFSAEQRIKEFSVRKVLGANVGTLLGLQLKEIMSLILISYFIALPTGYYIMSGWLKDFAYKTDLNINLLLFPGLVTFVAASLTVSYHVIKTAFTNPVDSLRNE